MGRIKSYSENPESILDIILSRLRFGKIIDIVPCGSVVLDLGCGFNGKMLRKISGRISKAVGVDVSVAEEKISKKIALINHDLNSALPFSENEFDIVSSLAVIEHLEEYNLHIRESFRVLKKGGKLVLTTPDPRSERLLLFLAGIGLISKEEIADHKRYFSKSFLEKIIKEAGFSHVKVSGFQFGFNNLVIARK